MSTRKCDIEFKVASYALYDTIKGLHNSSEDNSYMEIIVTKEDNDLVVRCWKEYYPQSEDATCVGGLDANAKYTTSR